MRIHTFIHFLYVKSFRRQVEPFVNSCSALPAAPHMNNLHALVEGMRQACATKEPAVVAALVKKAVESILEGLTPQANQVGAGNHVGHR